MISRHVICLTFKTLSFWLKLEDLKTMWLARYNAYSLSVQPVDQVFIYLSISNKNNNNNKMLYLNQTGTKITLKKFPVSSLGIPNISQN